MSRFDVFEEHISRKLPRISRDVVRDIFDAILPSQDPQLVNKALLLIQDVRRIKVQQHRPVPLIHKAPVVPALRVSSAPPTRDVLQVAAIGYDATAVPILVARLWYAEAPVVPRAHLAPVAAVAGDRRAHVVLEGAALGAVRGARVGGGCTALLRVGVLPVDVPAGVVVAHHDGPGAPLCPGELAARLLGAADPVRPVPDDLRVEVVFGVAVRVVFFGGCPAVHDVCGWWHPVPSPNMFFHFFSVLNLIMKYNMNYYIIIDIDIIYIIIDIRIDIYFIKSFGKFAMNAIAFVCYFLCLLFYVCVPN